MIYYHSSLNKPLNLWGINIPLHDQRASRLFEFLQSHLLSSYFLTPSLKTFSYEELGSVHSDRYIRLLKENPKEAIVKCYDGYTEHLTDEDAGKMVERSLSQAWGTYEAISLSLKHNFIYYLGGGMHHAMRDEGRGFCLIHDIALAIKKLQQEMELKNIWIIDVDAHKGDGSAEIFQGDPIVKTLSIHMKEGWPLDGSEDERSFIPSTIDIPMERDEEELYLSKLEMGLTQLISEGVADLAIVVHGMDVWEGDELKSSEGIRLSKEQVLERDQLLFSFLDSLHIPQTYLMAGGYGEKSWELYAQFLDKVLKS